MLILIVSLFVKKIKILRTLFSKIKLTTWIMLLVIISISIYVRLEVVPQEHIVYYDEFHHISLANRIATNNEYCECLKGDFNECSGQCILVAWPPGHHVLLSNIFRIFGASSKIAFSTNAIIGSLTGLIIFLTIYLKTKKEYLAILASIFMLGIPAHIKFSGTSILGISSLFFAILSFLALEIYLRDKTFSSWILFLATSLYMTYIRPENFIFIPIIGAYVLTKFVAKNQHYIKQFRINKYVLSVILTLILLTPLLLHYNWNDDPGWNDNIDKKIENIKANAPVNFRYIISQNYTPLILIVLSVLGIGNILVNKRFKETLCHITFFLMYFSIYTMYHIGQFVSTGTRYTLILFVPIIFLAIDGISNIRNLTKIRPTIISSIIIVIFIISIFPAKSFILEDGRHPERIKQYESINKLIQKNILIIAFNPVPFRVLLNHRTSTYGEYKNSKDGLEYQIVYYKESHWDGIKSLQAIEETELRQDYNFELLLSDSNNEIFLLTLKNVTKSQ